jgi:UDP-glucose 4-epimerase
VAFRAEPGGQVAALFVSCEGQQAIPLRILSRRLFFGIGAKRVMAQEQVSLNGTEAIHTLLEGRVKDAEVMVSSYVAKDATCVYDLVYVAAHAAFEERLPEFERFVKGWVLTGKGSTFQVPGSK